MRELVFLTGLAVSAAALAGSPVVNGDFEQADAKGHPVGWHLPPQFHVGTNDGSNASRGLVFENEDSKFRQAAASQRLKVKPGEVYSLGGWVQVDRLDKGGGCMFSFIWFDGDGKYIGETQTHSLHKATKDWVKLEAITRPMPTNAVWGSFGFYSRNGNVGRIRVDKAYCDIYVRKAVIDVYSNAYRYEAAEGPVHFAAALTPAAFGTDAKDVRALFAVRRPDGTRFEVDGKMPVPDEAHADIDIERFGIGTNRVLCAVLSGGKVVGKAEHPFVRTVTTRPRKTRIDRFGRAIVDGKPFLPIGAMHGNFCTPEAIARYVDSDFNSVMLYGEQKKGVLDAFGKANVKVVYWLAEHMNDEGTNWVKRVVTEYRDHPAIMGWYLYDERPTSEVPMLTARYNLVAAMDPDHPMWMVLDYPEEARNYLGSFDVFGGDCYPIPWDEASKVTRLLHEASSRLMGVCSMWQAPQFCNLLWYGVNRGNPRNPTYAEMRNMAWQEFAGGARGIFGFCVNDFGVWKNNNADERDIVRVWEDVKRVAKEIRSYERQLLLAVTREIPASQLPAGVVGRTFEENAERWTLLVNTTNERRGELAPLGVSMTSADGK